MKKRGIRPKSLREGSSLENSWKECVAFAKGYEIVWLLYSSQECVRPGSGFRTHDKAGGGGDSSTSFISELQADIMSREGVFE